MTTTFDPDWVVHPGATLDDWMDEHERPWYTLCLADGPGCIPARTVYRVLFGEEPIDRDLAERLHLRTGISTDLWLNLEKTFRAGLAAGKHWDGGGMRRVRTD